MIEHSQSLNKSIQHIIVVALCFFAFLLLRLSFMQLINAHHFLYQGKKNFLRIESVQPPRGNILDLHGTPLATNRPVTHLYWQGTGNNRFSEEQQALLHQLETILHKPIISDEQLQKEFTRTERRYGQRAIALDISMEQLGKIIEQFPHSANLLIRTDFKRYYPYGSYASHILGYLSRSWEMDALGQMGLEKICEPLLKGQEGKLLKTINSMGRILHLESLKDSHIGDNIYTTLDFELQAIIEKIFPEHHSGTCILMDPLDGSIFSLMSHPNFDPTIFLNPINSQHWSELQQKKPFLNRAFQASYPPGSIFKLVTMSAALEHNFVKPDDTTECKGFVDFCDRKYWCNNHQGHGQVTATQSLGHSCNDLFFKIGQVMDIDLIAEYGYKFGLGKQTGIVFPEKMGIIPSRAWKQEYKGESWWPGETLSATIGQSFVLVTPIQIARMIGSIFTGFLVKPRILADEPIEREPIDILPETRQFLKKGMKWVVKKGTGRGVNTVKDIEIYAKTSTAQTSSKTKRHLGNQYLEHGWFVAYIKYKENPPLVLVIMIEHAGSSQVAKLVAQKFLIEYKKLIDAKTGASTESIVPAAQS